MPNAMKRELDPEAIVSGTCGCGGRVTEDRAPFQELTWGRTARRFKCFSCGRDRFVRPGE